MKNVRLWWFHIDLPNIHIFRDNTIKKEVDILLKYAVKKIGKFEWKKQNDFEKKVEKIL